MILYCITNQKDMEDVMKTFISFAIWLVFLFVANTASAALLTFDDLPDIVPVNGPLPIDSFSDYGGLTWENMNYTDPDEFNQRLDNIGNSGFENGLVSSNHVAFNNADSTAAISTNSGQLIDFLGCYLTGGWRDGLNIQVQGFKDGYLLYDDLVVVDSTSPTWFSFEYFSIDTITLFSYGGTAHGYSAGDSDYSFVLDGSSFVMDNFTFNEAPVPEPSTLLLFIIGLLSSTSVAKRFRHFRRG